MNNTKKQRKTIANLPLGLPGGSVVKNTPAKQETCVLTLGWENFLEKEMATHSVILAWESRWTEESGKLVNGVAKSQTQLSN